MTSIQLARALHAALLRGVVAVELQVCSSHPHFPLFMRQARLLCSALQTTCQSQHQVPCYTRNVYLSACTCNASKVLLQGPALMQSCMYFFQAHKALIFTAFMTDEETVLLYCNLCRLVTVHCNEIQIASTPFCAGYVTALCRTRSSRMCSGG